jgi:hypothetical protein
VPVNALLWGMPSFWRAAAQIMHSSMFDSVCAPPYGKTRKQDLQHQLISMWNGTSWKADGWAQSWRTRLKNIDIATTNVPAVKGYQVYVLSSTYPTWMATAQLRACAVCNDPASPHWGNVYLQTTAPVGGYTLTLRDLPASTNLIIMAELVDPANPKRRRTELRYETRITPAW